MKNKITHWLTKTKVGYLILLLIPSIAIDVIIWILIPNFKIIPMIIGSFCVASIYAILYKDK